MAGELGRDRSLPLLPAGSTLFESLPAGALVLDALAPAIGNGMITMSEADSEGALVVRNGVVAERVWVTNGVRSHGDEALALIRLADTAMVSARKLGDDAMVLLGPLLHGDPCYTDLRLEWVAWPQFLRDLCARDRTFIVEVNTPAGRGVTCIQGGRQVATFAESHPALGDASLLDDIAAGGVGTVRVLVDVGAVDEREPAVAPIVEPSFAGAVHPELATSVTSEPASPERIESYVLPNARSEQVESHALPVAMSEHNEPPATPVAMFEHNGSHATPVAMSMHNGSPAIPVEMSDRAEPYVLPPARGELDPPVPALLAIQGTDDPNATFSAMFGAHQDPRAEHRLIARDHPPTGAERDVASVLPQLRLLVQHRLQRSSASVEEIVENAAADQQSVGWLSDRVRVMSMRGFLHSTFDQLADDMLALAGRDPA